MKILVEWNEGSKVLEYDKVITAEELLEDVKEVKYPIMSCNMDNYPKRLDVVIDHDCTITLLDIRNKNADLVMQKSMVLLYVKAIHDVLGEDTEVVIENALSKGLFTVIKKKYTTSDIKKIEARMHELVHLKLPIIETKVDEEHLEEWVKTHHMARNYIETTLPIPERVKIYTLNDESFIFDTDLVTNTKQLKVCGLRKYKHGVLLRFPSPENPLKLPKFKEEKLLYRAFAEETRWCKITEVIYASDLNKMIKDKNYKDLILLSESLHEKKIAEIANQIKKENKRIILIAGPSSSGKTTFTKKLIIQLRVNGLKPLYLGTDDYFVEREETPVDKDGNKDYEGLGALDIKLFDDQMTALLRGEEVDIPSFDFVKGTKVFGKRITKIDKNQPIVIEGIHGLNPKLTEMIPDEEKFKIYISPLTQINIDEFNRISTTDARMLRRLVRDYATRGKSAQDTLQSWPSVRRGEDQNIFPYNIYADAFFNSACIYEIPVLKHHAKKLLEEIPHGSKEYPTVKRIVSLLKFFEELDDDASIPCDSILREFIGGSIVD